MGTLGHAAVQVWTFVLNDASFKMHVNTPGAISAGSDVSSKKIKIVCMDAKLMTVEDE